ncbi:MAG: Holliday junction resolvase [Candidatus Aenigmarchaeota archaeon]|nr:Holliday junction resolvase [Candidatus Aenigmarchaeota archaeon]
MPSYSKGAKGERELIHILNSRGFSVMRAPSSGGAIYPLDIVAIRKGLVLAFEIKTWNRKPYLEAAQVSAFREWCEKAGAMGFLGWRGRGKWSFLRIEDALNSNYKDESWISMEGFLRTFAGDA